MDDGRGGQPWHRHPGARLCAHAGRRRALHRLPFEGVGRLRIEYDPHPAAVAAHIRPIISAAADVVGKLA